MSDRIACEIRIGGRVSRTAISKTDDSLTVLEALMGAISQEGVSSEWGGANEEPKSESELMELMDGGYIHLYDNEASFPEMNDLITVLREEGIPYQLTSGTTDAYLGSDEFWLPDMDAPLSFLCDNDGKHLIHADDVRKFIDALKAAPIPYTIPAKAMEKLKKLCPVVPVIPDFEIVK